MEELSVVKKNFIQYIDHIVSHNKISHTYLIEISDYECDMKYIIDFVKMILCNLSYEELEQSDNPIIHLIDQSNYPDLLIIEPDGNMIKKSQMIDLQKEYSNKSLLNNKRIYIIKNVEKFNVSSANTMLKFLEEPEDDIIAILVTNNRYQVIDTILSRCQILSLKEILLFDIQDKDTLELLDCVVHPNKFFVQYNHFINDIIVDKNIAKEKLNEIESALTIYLTTLYSSICNNNTNVGSLLTDVDSKKIVSILSVFEEEIPKLEFNVNYKLWLDSLFSKFLIGG